MPIVLPFQSRLPQNPQSPDYQDLQDLLTNGTADDPIKLAAMRDQRKSELEDMLAAASTEPPVVTGFGGQGGDPKNATGQPMITPNPNGGEYGRLAKILGIVKDDLAEDPNTGTAAKAAMMQGFGSPQQAAGYGRQVAGQAAASTQNLEAAQAEEARSQAGYTNVSTEMARHAMAGPSGVGQPVPGSDTVYDDIENSARAPAADSSWGAFLTGKGGAKYNSLSDLAGAENERLKYDNGIATPFASLMQSQSFGNLQQVVAMFPSVRGFQRLIPLIQAHQANWGHETPLNTYLRESGVSRMLDETEKEMGQVSNQYKFGPKGAVPQVDPQTMKMAREALVSARHQANNVMGGLKTMYPGIDAALGTVGLPNLGGVPPPGSKLLTPSHPPGGSNYEEVP